MPADLFATDDTLEEARGGARIDALKGSHRRERIAHHPAIDGHQIGVAAESEEFIEIWIELRHKARRAGEEGDLPRGRSRRVASLPLAHPPHKNQCATWRAMYVFIWVTVKTTTAATRSP